MKKLMTVGLVLTGFMGQAVAGDIGQSMFGAETRAVAKHMGEMSEGKARRCTSLNKLISRKLSTLEDAFEKKDIIRIRVSSRDLGALFVEAEKEKCYPPSLDGLIQGFKRNAHEMESLSAEIFQ